MSTFPGTSKREKQYQANHAFGDRRDGVVSTRMYFYASEAKCDSHMETFLCCIEASGGGGGGASAGCIPARHQPGEVPKQVSLRFKFVKMVGTRVRAEPGLHSSCAMSSALLLCLITLAPWGMVSRLGALEVQH